MVTEIPLEAVGRWLYLVFFTGLYVRFGGRDMGLKVEGSYYTE
jgi:hypothetical protein